MLIKPGRCRLQLIPLVDSNPVIKAGRHQSLWRLYLSPEGGWGVGGCAHLSFATIVTAGCRLDSSGLPVHALHSVFLQMEDGRSSSTPQWKCQPASYLRDAGYQTISTFMTLWEERVSLKRSRMPRVIPQGRLCFQPTYQSSLSKLDACLAAFKNSWHTSETERKGKRTISNRGWGTWGADVCQAVNGCEGRSRTLCGGKWFVLRRDGDERLETGDKNVSCSSSSIRGSSASRAEAQQRADSSISSQPSKFLFHSVSCREHAVWSSNKAKKTPPLSIIICTITMVCMFQFTTQPTTAQTLTFR